MNWWILGWWMRWNESTIINAARTIKPILPELLDPKTAAQVEQQLEILLTEANSGQLIDNQLTETLRAHETNQTWMHHYLKGEAPTDRLQSQPFLENI